MISYFKHTLGESFTLSGENYDGFFHVNERGEAYTGKKFTSTSKLLSGKPTFLTNSFLRRMEFNRVTGDVTKIILPSITPRTFIDQTYITTILDILDSNNQIIFNQNIVYNPSIVSYEDLTMDQHNHMFALTSTEVDSREPDDQLMCRAGYYQIDPFSYSSDWAFLDTAEGAHVVPTYDTKAFYYLITTPTGGYTLSGSFVGEGGLIKTTNALNANTNLLFDSQNDRIYEISDREINVYDFSFFRACQTFSKIDSFNITDENETLLNRQAVAIGDKLRGSIIIDQNGKTVLRLNNKYSTELFLNISPRDLNLDGFVAFDIRQQDDNLIIVGEKSGKKRLIHIDPALIVSNVSEGVITDTVLEYLFNKEFHYSDIDGNMKLFFSPIDSSLFFIYTKNYVQTRLVSKPALPVGTLDRENLVFLDDYLFDTTEERFDRINIKFNSNKLKSNYLNALHLIPGHFHFNDTGTQFYLFHNTGRIYTIQTEYDYLAVLPLTLHKAFVSSDICNSSGFELTFNNRLFEIITDTITLYNNLSYTFKSKINNKIPDFRQFTGLVKVEQVFDDFYFHNNESVNTLAIGRIISKIYDLQKSIIDTLNDSNN